MGFLGISACTGSWNLGVAPATAMPPDPRANDGAEADPLWSGGIRAPSQRSPRIDCDTSGVESSPRELDAARVLVVDDEPAITELVATTLRYEGFEVATAGNALDALATAAPFDPQLAILDVMIPDVDGFELQRRLTALLGRLPTIFLTARDATEDKVRGLTSGADDYVTKPFSLEELVARVRAVLRRADGSQSTTASLTYSDVELDEDAHLVTRAGTVVELTGTEYKLLRYFLLNPGRVLSKQQILGHVWQYDFGGETGNVETYVSYLRRKLDRLGPQLIHTVRGVGYVLRSPNGR